MLLEVVAVLSGCGPRPGRELIGLLVRDVTKTEASRPLTIEQSSVNAIVASETYAEEGGRGGGVEADGPTWCSVEPPKGVEPLTYALRVRRSTD